MTDRCSAKLHKRTRKALLAGRAPKPGPQQLYVNGLKRRGILDKNGLPVNTGLQQQQPLPSSNDPRPETTVPAYVTANTDFAHTNRTSVFSKNELDREAWIDDKPEDSESVVWEPEVKVSVMTQLLI